MDGFGDVIKSLKEIGTLPLAVVAFICFCALVAYLRHRTKHSEEVRDHLKTVSGLVTHLPEEQRTAVLPAFNDYRRLVNGDGGPFYVVAVLAFLLLLALVAAFIAAGASLEVIAAADEACRDQGPACYSALAERIREGRTIVCPDTTPAKPTSSAGDDASPQTSSTSQPDAPALSAVPLATAQPSSKLELPPPSAPRPSATAPPSPQPPPVSPPPPAIAADALAKAFYKRLGEICVDGELQLSLQAQREMKEAIDAEREHALARCKQIVNHASVGPLPASVGTAYRSLWSELRAAWVPCEFYLGDTKSRSYPDCR